LGTLALGARSTIAVAALLVLGPFGMAAPVRMADAQGQASPSDEAAQGAARGTRMVEIRSYNLKPGTRSRFHQLFLREALPMLQRWKIDVVAYGPSLHDADSFYLMRAYESLAGRQKSEDAFYGSSEWRDGPREAILADIDSYTTVVIRLDDLTLQGLRRTVENTRP
jgi:hypothetical protein